jgi:hypothetical protein
LLEEGSWQQPILTNLANVYVLSLITNTDNSLSHVMVTALEPGPPHVFGTSSWTLGLREEEDMYIVMMVTAKHSINWFCPPILKLPLGDRIIRRIFSPFGQHWNLPQMILTRAIYSLLSCHRTPTILMSCNRTAQLIPRMTLTLPAGNIVILLKAVFATKPFGWNSTNGMWRPGNIGDHPQATLMPNMVLTTKTIHPEPWEQLLCGYNNKNILVNSLRYGWDLGFLPGPAQPNPAFNQHSTMEYPDSGDSHTSQELMFGKLVGPTPSVLPFPIFCSPLGSVPEPGNKESMRRCITLYTVTVFLNKYMWFSNTNHKRLSH